MPVSFRRFWRRIGLCKTTRWHTCGGTHHRADGEHDGTGDAGDDVSTVSTSSDRVVVESWQCHPAKDDGDVGAGADDHGGACDSVGTGSVNSDHGDVESYTPVYGTQLGVETGHLVNSVHYSDGDGSGDSDSVDAVPVSSGHFLTTRQVAQIDRPVDSMRQSHIITKMTTTVSLPLTAAVAAAMSIQCLSVPIALQINTSVCSIAMASRRWWRRCGCR